MKRIKQAAQELLPAQTLLRGSHAPAAAPETLLRPAATVAIDTSPEQLLRPWDRHGALE